MIIKFKKKPDYYDWHGSPMFTSRCGHYRILWIRTGYVKGKKKPKKYFWKEHFYVHYNRGRKPGDFTNNVGVFSGFRSRKDAIEAANEFANNLKAEKKADRKLKKKHKK